MRIYPLATVAAAMLITITGCSASEQKAADESLPPATSTPAEPTGSVWVADENGNSLTVLNAATNTVATTLTGIPGPHNVQISRDGSTAYATSVGTDTLVAVDTASYRVKAAAPTGPHPAHVIEAPNGKVYVANSGDGSVSVFDADLQPAGRIELGGMPHGLRAAANGSVIVVADHHGGAVDLIDPSTDRMIGQIPVGNEPAQVAVTADGRYAYTGTNTPPAVVKVDLKERKVVGTTPVPTDPIQLYLTPDDATVLSADQGTESAPGNTLSVIDTTSMTARTTVRTGSGPHGVVIDPAGTRAWVTDTFDDTVSVIDLAGPSVSATIPVGALPNGVSYSDAPPAPGAASIALDIPAVATASPQPDHGQGHG